MSLKIEKRVKSSGQFFNKPRNEKANHEFCYFKSFVASSRMCIWSMVCSSVTKIGL